MSAGICLHYIHVTAENVSLVGKMFSLDPAAAHKKCHESEFVIEIMFQQL